MLKYWVALLVVLNALALAWQWDALAPWGWGPAQHQEPERLQQQLRPEAIQPVIALPPQDAPSGQEPSPSDTSASGAAQGPHTAAQPALQPASSPAPPPPLSSSPAALPVSPTAPR